MFSFYEEWAPCHLVSQTAPPEDLTCSILLFFPLVREAGVSLELVCLLLLAIARLLVGPMLQLVGEMQTDCRTAKNWTSCLHQFQFCAFASSWRVFEC